MDGCAPLAENQTHQGVGEPVFQLVRIHRAFLAFFLVLPGFVPPNRATGLVEFVFVFVAAVENLADELLLALGQCQGDQLVHLALQARWARQVGGDFACVGQRLGADGGGGVLGDPSLDLGAEQLLAAPIVVDQVRALAHVDRAVGNHRQAELLKGVRTARQQEQVVHQCDGVIQQVRVLSGQAHDAGIEQRHVVIGQAFFCQYFRQGAVQRAFAVIAVLGVERVAQQGAGGDAFEQCHGRVVEKRVRVDQQRAFRGFEDLAQQHVLGAEMVAVGFAPALARGVVQCVDLHRQPRVGRWVIAEHLDVQRHVLSTAQMRECAGDAEYRFLMVGLGAKYQVNQLWARSRGRCIHLLLASIPGVCEQKKPPYKRGPGYCLNNLSAAA